MESNKIIIGTRGSILALAQAEKVKEMLIERYDRIRNSDDFQGIEGFSGRLPLQIELKVIVTTGDKDLRDFKKMRGETQKEIFVKEIEREMLEGKIDMAVHSLKDMPQVTPEGLLNACFPIREDNRDVLISRKGEAFSDLPAYSVIGTGSVRRESEVMNLRKDITVKPIRGNIHTRLGKLHAGEYDAIILAAAGIKRTGLEKEISEYFEADRVMPAPGQGILCIQCREKDRRIRRILEEIDDREVRIMCETEREFSRIFDGGCHAPIGCSSVIKGNRIYIKGMYSNGNRRILTDIEGEKENYRHLVKELCDKMKKEILK